MDTWQVTPSDAPRATGSTDCVHVRGAGGVTINAAIQISPEGFRLGLHPNLGAFREGCSQAQPAPTCMCPAWRQGILGVTPSLPFSLLVRDQMLIKCKLHRQP